MRIQSQHSPKSTHHDNPEYSSLKLIKEERESLLLIPSAGVPNGNRMGEPDARRLPKKVPGRERPHLSLPGANSGVKTARNHRAGLKESTRKPKKSGDTPLSNGSQGVSVRSVQKRLQMMGYDVAVDGRFGAQTQTAIKSFQQADGLAVDGVVGPKTMSAIQQAFATSVAQQLIKSGSVNHQSSKRVTLNQGARGQLVEGLQRKLGTLGYKIGADGHFGKQTKEAVRLFQSTHGLRVDGVAGPETLLALDSVLASASRVTQHRSDSLLRPEDARVLHNLQRTDFIILENGKAMGFEGYSLDVYFPGGDKSGVTVGTGFDLHQHTEADLRALGLDQDEILLLRPYMQPVGEAARAFVHNNPLQLPESLVAKLDEANFVKTIEFAEEYFGEEWKNYSIDLKTTLIAAYHQYGSKTRLWGQLKDKNYLAAYRNLGNWGDKTRDLGPNINKKYLGMRDRALAGLYTAREV
jgi:peptidoglycan hydrolase-like protein with peptidoglycan-binding domain